MESGGGLRAAIARRQPAKDTHLAGIGGFCGTFQGFHRILHINGCQTPGAVQNLIARQQQDQPHLDYLIERQKRLHAVIEPVFKNAQACGYFKGFDHDSFSVYVRALVETPIATRDLTNQLLKDDIRSEKGIALHTERVLRFLFHKET